MYRMDQNGRWLHICHSFVSGCPTVPQCSTRNPRCIELPDEGICPVTQQHLHGVIRLTLNSLVVSADAPKICSWIIWVRAVRAWTCQVRPNSLFWNCMMFTTYRQPTCLQRCSIFVLMHQGPKDFPWSWQNQISTRTWTIQNSKLPSCKDTPAWSSPTLFLELGPLNRIDAWEFLFQTIPPI